MPPWRGSTRGLSSDACPDSPVARKVHAWSTTVVDHACTLRATGESGQASDESPRVLPRHGGMGRHERLDLRGLARPRLPPRASAARLAALVRHAVPDRRAQRLVLPAAA